jgi:phosphoenolpyruvate carboxylase
LRCYRREVRELFSHLSQSFSRIGIDAAVLEANRRYRERIGTDTEPMPERYRSMPYRELLKFIEARIRDTGTGAAHAYASAGELLDDLELIGTSLKRHKGEHAGWFALQRLITRVRTFGFHLAALDVRQDALVHRRVVGQGLGVRDWLDWSAAQRTERLTQAFENDTQPETAFDEEGRATLEIFRAIKEIQASYGAASIGPYIISMTQDTDDILSVLLLARWAGLGNSGERVPLDVCPLLETVADLTHGPEMFAKLMAHPLYRRHLEARGGRQMIMVGYSDSMKDGGLAASRWAVQRAQQRLVEEAERAGVRLTVFHGHGGTVSRGGGKSHRGILAAPRGAVNGRLRATEQGEIIDTKYGMRGIAVRSLEQMVGAVMQATALPGTPRNPPAHWHDVMQTIARESRRVYRALVYDEPRFFGYFRQATPIDVIERMAISSRPPSRRTQTGIEDLRAIPWVFSWTQNRTILTGWFGLGSGLKAALAEGGQEPLREMLANWPFFANLVNDAEMVLAKADMEIAARYNELADVATRPLWEMISDEHRLTVDMLLSLKGTTELLDEDETLQRSIRLRNPYVDPLSLLQIDLLGRWRAAERQDDALLDALFTVTKGIAQGLRNTG